MTRPTHPRTPRAAAPMPATPHLRRLAAMGVRWADEPEPTGAAPDDAHDDQGDDATGSDSDDPGYPEGVPVREMTRDQRAAYDVAKREQNRARRDEWRQVLGDRDPAQVRADYEELQRLRKGAETAEETALREAREAGRKEAAQGLLTNVVRSSLTAHLSAQGIDDDEVSGLLDVIDPSKFLTDDDVDLQKVRDFAARQAPAKGDARAWPDTGRGNPVPPKASGVQAGRDRYAARRRTTA